jgi:hypothetical protein
VLSTEQEAKIDLLATKAKQDLLLAELELKANLNETQTVSVATLPLPSGAATSTKQSDGTQKTQIVDSDGTVADVVQLGTQVTSSDKGIVTNTVIHGLNSAGGGSYVDVKVTPSGALTIEANAGDDLNTSLLALEAGGNLEDIASNTIKGLQSTVNTSITPLNNGVTFTGTGEQNLYSDVFVVCKTDQSGLLYFDFSVDNTNWETFPSSGFTVTAGIQEAHKAVKAGRYFRVRMTNNSGSNQTYLRLYTYYGAFDQLNAPLTNTPSSDSDSITTKSVIIGQTDAGQFKFVGVDENGNLKTAIENPKTAFGELSIAELTPVAQISFEYSSTLNTQLVTSAVTGTGTVTASNSLLSVATGASASSSAQLISRRYAKYRAGQGVLGRFTMLFTTGVANSKQYGGIGNSALTDGFCFGYSGATFGLFHINAGVETFIAQSSWNIDVMDGSDGTSNPSGMLLDPTKGNVGQIKYQYLGFGCIYFYIEHDIDGEMSLVHIIRYPNSATATSLANPSLNLIWRVVNTSNTSNIVLKAGSGALFVEGEVHMLGAKNGIDNNKNTITTLTNILSLKNATTYNTVTNRGQIRLRGVSCAYDGGNGVATLQIILNPTVGGVPSFTTINGSTVDNGVTITTGQSIVSYDVAGTTITGGTILFNTTVPRNYGQYINLEDLDIFASPSDIIVFAMKATSSGTCAVAANWVEDI